MRFRLIGFREGLQGLIVYGGGGLGWSLVVMGFSGLMVGGGGIFVARALNIIGPIRTFGFQASGDLDRDFY